MDLSAELDAIIRRSEAVKQKKRKEKTILYAEGVRSKMRQAELAIGRVTNLKNASDDTVTSTDSNKMSIAEEVNFYCDAFWIFLFASLDVSAQIINQAYHLGLSERQVSFKWIASHMPSSEAALKKQYDAICKSHPFKNAEKYRNCSAHRRPICIEETIRRVSRTAGYISSTEAVQAVERNLCDDPLSITPKFSKGRKIPEYLATSHQQLANHVAKLLSLVKFTP